MAVANVLLRYLFSYGSVWAQELEWHLLAPMILLGMSLRAAARRACAGGRVLRQASPPRDSSPSICCRMGCAILIALVFIKLSLGYAGQAWSIGERSADPGGIPFRWALKALIPLGFVLLALQTVAQDDPRWCWSSGKALPKCACLTRKSGAILMLVAFFVMLMLGVPVATTLATVGFVFGYLGFGDSLFNLLPARLYGVVAGYQWMAIPLFVFMGVMLEKSRLADDLLDVMGHIAGGVRGGMGVGIILFGVLMGATTGIVGATIITLGLLTLPTLIRRGYDKSIACGAICASGTLGQIIPPSLILILLADILQLSVGTLFAAAVVPGLLLSAIYIMFLLSARHGGSPTWCRRCRRPSVTPSAAGSCGCASGRWWCRRSCWWSRCSARSSAASRRRPRRPRWARWGRC